MRAFVLAACLVNASVAGAADSAYTTFDIDAGCLQLSEDEVGGSWRCDGYRGARIWLSEGDVRQSVFYGEVGSWYEAGAFESFAAFNHAGATVEWRVDDGSPYATIRRWFVSAGEDDRGKPRPDVQVLVVSRVGQRSDGEACVVGYVEATANPDANEIARRVADEEARDFACRYAEPMWHGERRATDVGTVHVFGEPGVE